MSREVAEAATAELRRYLYQNECAPDLAREVLEVALVSWAATANEDQA